MGYLALLFCPDEKTARTVTQVLSELEFSVEACLEPFAAVKKLMGEHFDAVVVDCDNEQNATLLFKSARNSTSNQTSLAVAVVEGQAGVAKAFRIGANLVLTKPINIEQAKGTLRVARGLLRKADPAKPGAQAVATASSSPTPAAPATPAAPKPAPKPVVAAKPIPPAAPKPAAAAPPVAKQIPVPKPAVSAPAWPAAAASATPSVQGSDLLERPAAKVVPAAMPEPVATEAEPVLPRVEKVPDATAPVASHAPSPTSFSSSGAASAPAPAREPHVQSTVEVPAKPEEAAVSEPASAASSAPMFSYGGSPEPASSGGNKKIFIGIAAAVVIAVAAYFGWSQYQAHSAGSANAPASAAETATVTQPVAAQPSTPTSVTPAAAPAENVNKTSAANAGTETSELAAKEPAAKESVSHSASSTKPSASSTASKPTVAESQEEQPEPAPLMVKRGKEPAQPKSAAADVSAPSMIGMATPASAPPPDLVPSTTSEFTPKLQTVNISQGVSQGLLYKKVSPVYPPAAMRMRVEGAVQLVATISKNGDITHVKALSGDTLLTKAAVDAVKQWKYKPYLLNGEPVEIQTQVTINFKLPN